MSKENNTAEVEIFEKITVETSADSQSNDESRINEQQSSTEPRNNEQQNVEQKNNEADYYPAFPSSALQLDIAKNEYEREKGRSDSLDNKTSIYIAAIVAIITVYIQILPFGNLIDLMAKATKCQALVLGAVIVAFLFGLFFMGKAFYLLTKAISIKNYKRVGLENLTNIELLASPEDQTADAMIRHFKDIIIHNEKVNNDKAEDLNKGLNSSIEGFVVLSISTVALLIVNGWIN